MRNYERITLILLAGMLQTVTHAQEIELDPITITSSLTEVKSSKTGRNIIIVSGEQLRKLPVHSIDELIRYLPGIEVQSRGPMGTQSNITMRGGTFQQVLVLVDGIRLNDPLTGHFNSYIPIAPAEIERIEILKGASSAIYGTEAVGGVVHIISKTFAAKQNSKNRQWQTQLAGGGYGLFNVQAGGHWQNNKTAFSAGIISNNANGQPLRGINGYFHNTTVSAAAKQQFNEHWSLAVRAAIDNRDFAAQNFFTTLVSDTATEKVASQWSHVRLAYQKAKQAVTVDIGYKHATDEFQLRKSVSANLNKSQLLQALIQHNIAIRENSRLVYGTQLQQRQIRSNDRGNHRIHQAAFFAVYQQQWGKLQMSPALRIDYHERAAWEVIPQINLSYRTGNIQWRGMAGKTTRDADFTERFNNYRRSPVPSGNRIGNPDLNEETSFSYEAGADYFLGNSFRISATWFQRFHRGLIDWVRTPYAAMPRQENLVNGGTYFLAKNIAEVNTYGVEADAQFTRKINDHSNVNAMLGFISLRSYSSDTVPSLYVSNHARLLINFNAFYRYKNLSVGVNGLYKVRTPQTAAPIEAVLSRDYFLMNLRLEYSLLPQKAAIFAQADNVFNRRYQDILGSIMPQRWLMGGLKLTL